MLYLDMNMVRAGVVNHPRQWPFCGYNEINGPRQRYTVIDYKKLIELLQMRDIAELQKTYNQWVDEILRGGTQTRESNPVPRIYIRGFRAHPIGEVQDIHPVRLWWGLGLRSYGVHLCTFVQCVLWYGVNGLRP